MNRPQTRIMHARRAQRVRRKYIAYGGSAEIFRTRAPRVLIEGPADTGKTRGLLQLVDHRCLTYPGIRVLLCRQTLQSLRESVLVTLEQKVWFPEHPMTRIVQSGASRETRRIYRYPAERGQFPSTVVLGGLEDPGWTYSMEYDIVCIFECWEVAWDSMERLYRSNRNHVLCRYHEANAELAAEVEQDWDDERWLRGHKCWQQIFADTNPGNPILPINKMAAPVGELDLEAMANERPPSRRVFASPDFPFVRVLSRHVDNPACTEDDKDKLRALTGNRRANLWLGLWAAAEGQIWENFDATVNMKTARIKREGVAIPDAMVDERPIYLELLNDDGTVQRVDIRYAFGTQDFGWTRAGCAQVWFVDYEGRMYRAFEIYYKLRKHDWWAKHWVDLYREFNLLAIVCDSEDPEAIEDLNDRMESYRGRRGARIARGVNKSVRAKERRGSGNVLKKTFRKTVMDMVRDAWDQGTTEQFGVPGPFMFLLRGAHERWGRDEALVEEKKPTSTEEEIPSYVFKKNQEGKPLEEVPDDSCEDHGCNCCEYAAVFACVTLAEGAERDPYLAPGTAGWRLGHDDVMRQSRNHELGLDEDEDEVL